MKQADEIRARRRFCQIFDGVSLCDLAKALPLELIRDLNIAYGVERAQTLDFCTPCEKEQSQEFYEVSKWTVDRAARKYGEFARAHIRNIKL